MNEARNMLKMMDPERVSVGANTYYIYPFPAFKAANMSGEIISLMMPMISAIAPALGKDKSVLDMEAGEAAPYIAGAFSTLSGDKVEKLLRNLLLSGNVAVQTEGSMDAQMMNEDLSNMLFCAEAQDMFILAWHVIKVNYKGFFGKFGNLSGSATIQQAMQKMTSPGMGPLT